MKILMIAPQPFFTPRGTPLSVYYRSKVLSDLGHEVDLLTYPIGMDVDIKNVNIIRSPRFPFIYDVKIGPSIAKIFLDILLFFHAVKLLVTRKYDCIHAHEEAVFFCILFKMLFRIDYIYDMHSSLPQQLENFNFTKLKPAIKAFEVLERSAVKRAKAIITICKDLEDQVHGYGYREKHELIENTIFSLISFSDDGCDGDLERLLNTRGKKTVLYTGTFEHYQGIDMYVDSLKHVLEKRDDVVFVFIGGKPQQVLDARRRVRELGLSEHTVFTGTLETNIVKRFLKNADCIVSPRIKGTNTPLKIYEYMASGVPIVATNLKTHTQELDPSSAYLAEPAPEAFAEKVVLCLEDGQSAGRYATEALDKYNQKYGESVYRKRLERIVGLVEGPAPEPA